MRRIAAAFLLALFSGVALSQYPTKPVRVVLHFPAGGSTDVVTRILANALGEAMALFGPAKMPAEIAQRVSKALNAIMARAQIREQVDKQGFALAGSTPQELGVFVKQQLAAWKRGFEDAGITPE